MDSPSGNEVLIQYGQSEVLEQPVYVITTLFPSDTDLTVIAEHLLRINDAFEQIGIKLMILSPKGPELMFAGIVFKGSERAHEIFVDSLLKTNLPLRINNFVSDRSLRLALLSTLKQALENNVFTDTADTYFTALIVRSLTE